MIFFIFVNRNFSPGAKVRKDLHFETNGVELKISSSHD